jgi:transposase-like protein
MTDLLAALRMGGSMDIIREALASVLQALIAAEAIQQIGVGRYERTETCAACATGPEFGCRPGRRRRAAHPQVPRGLILPHPASTRRRIDRALLAVVLEAYVRGNFPSPSRPAPRP